MKFIQALFLGTTLSVCPILTHAQAIDSFNPEETLWFKNPATDWRTQALHLGNGYMGVSFYGGIDTESFDIAEETFWTGGPNVTPGYNHGIIPGGKEHIEELRKLVSENRIKEADQLARNFFVGNYEGYGYFSKVGTMKLDFGTKGANVENYQRGLDLSQSIGFVRFKRNGVNFNREYFCSYPDRQFVVHLNADKEKQISFQLKADWQYQTEKPVVEGKKNEWMIRGLIEESGMKYCMRIRVVQEGGTLTCTPEKLCVDNATEATLYYTVETEYKKDGPSFKGNNPVKNTKATFAKTRKASYKEIRERHVNDYTNLYNRVSFHLAGDKQLAALPTDERIAQLKAGMIDDSQLKTLYFNLGRYSIISASRETTLPSTLQGVWNHFKQAPWNGNYQSNINLQEMYWSCGPTDLPECQESYVNWVKMLIEPGRRTAKEYYGTEGWVTHATSNIWAFTAPGSDITWGAYPMAAAWHCRHVWNQFEYTDNVEYLKNTAYPIMREAALFYMQNLQKGSEGLYMVGSSSSEHGIEMETPEKAVRYSTRAGETSEQKIFLTPNFQDIEMMYDLFSNVIKANEILKTDNDFAQMVKEKRNQLVPLKIGRYGQLQEWMTDVDNPRDHHRHISHMYALYPGEMITMDKNPALCKAAEVSLNMRGDGVFKDRWPHSGGNWSSAWRMGCRARLLDGERAIHIFNQMIKQVGFENMMSHQSNNFQVDAMMATPGLFAELLMQSHDGFIHLLPALPTEWPEGEINNLVARGGYRVSMQWNHGQLVKAVIAVPEGKTCPTLRLKNKIIQKDDNRIEINRL